MVSCLRSLWGLGMVENFGYLGCLFPSQDLKAFNQSLVPDESLYALLAESPEAPSREGQWSSWRQNHHLLVFLRERKKGRVFSSASPQCSATDVHNNINRQKALTGLEGVWLVLLVWLQFCLLKMPFLGCFYKKQQLTFIESSLASRQHTKYLTCLVLIHLFRQAPGLPQRCQGTKK